MFVRINAMKSKHHDMEYTKTFFKNSTISQISIIITKFL